jgi:[acyl-carrier-protein] S-malonyltransferase
MATPFAFVFPGQGSQAVGMLDAWGDHPEVKRTLDEASAALGEDVAALIQHGPKEQLDLTTNTQPVMLTAGVACYRAWLAETGLTPAAVAGHSLGEYSALVAAGALSLADALPLVRFRAQAMQEAVPVGVGAMYAILGLDGEAVRAGCAQVVAETGEVIEAVNFNDRALPLSVSAPFHSSLMKPAAERLREKLATVSFAKPAIAVINNIDVAVAQDDAGLRDALYRQAFGPVRWVEVVQALKARGLTHIIECGPGKVLAGMAKRIDAEIVSATLFDPASLAEVRSLLTA